MKKIAVLIFTYYFLQLYVTAQQQYVIANAGDYYKKSTCSISWTLGESVIGFKSKSTCSISQGFQHGNLVVHEIPNSIFKSTDSEIKIFPIPASDFITIKMDDFYAETTVEIYNLTGQEIIQKMLSGFLTTIDLSNIKPGQYILKIVNSDQGPAKSYKIVKF